MDRTVDDTIIGTWVNQAYQHISGVFNWPWLFKTSILQTTADITTGTVSINAAASTGIFSSAPTSSVATDYMIKFTDTSDDWYTISTHTAASTTFTINVPFVGTSNISAADYIVRRVFYSLASDVDRIIDFRQTITDNKLQYVDSRTFDRLLPDPTATGSPLFYSLNGLDSSKYWRINLYPIPDAVINLQYRYYQRITEMTSDTEEPLIPAKWHNAIVFGALALYGHPFIDDTRFKFAAERFKLLLENMQLHFNHVPDEMVVIQPWDARPRSAVGRLRYPSNYPDVYGGY